MGQSPSGSGGGSPNAATRRSTDRELLVCDLMTHSRRSQQFTGAFPMRSGAGEAYDAVVAGKDSATITSCFRPSAAMHYLQSRVSGHRVAA